MWESPDDRVILETVVAPLIDVLLAVKSIEFEVELCPDAEFCMLAASVIRVINIRLITCVQVGTLG
jgi:hypothetical protein